MKKLHQYKTQLYWEGNLGQGTENYRNYKRNYSIEIEGKAPIQGSADPSFRGDVDRYNPEELLVASLSACHMLWYLHLCAKHKIRVWHYEDQAQGIMEEDKNGSGYFKEVILCPKVEVYTGDDLTLAEKLHEEANKMCFIANSVNFPVKHKPSIRHYLVGDKHAR